MPTGVTQPALGKQLYGGSPRGWLLVPLHVGLHGEGLASRSMATVPTDCKRKLHHFLRPALRVRHSVPLLHPVGRPSWEGSRGGSADLLDRKSIKEFWGRDFRLPHTSRVIFSLPVVCSTADLSSDTSYMSLLPGWVCRQLNLLPPQPPTTGRRWSAAPWSPLATSSLPRFTPPSQGSPEAVCVAYSFKEMLHNGFGG